MDLNDNAFFDDIIYVEYDDSDSEKSDDLKENLHGKKNKKKITFAQSEKLMSTMDGRTDNIAKGKIKSDEGTKKLLDEWDQLTLVLNDLGPPCHTSSKWRRIWTKMKSNKKRKSVQTSVLLSRDGNKKVKYHQSSTSDQIYPKSSAKDENVIGVEPVELEQSQHTASIEKQLSHIAQAIVSLGEQQAVAFAAMNKKLELYAIQQADMTVKMNLLAKAIGVDVDATKM